MLSKTMRERSNPIITKRRNADPSPRVFNGRVYLYCSHDQDDATDYASMDNYYVYSSADLVHWTDHGEVLNSSQLINQWGGAAGLWAPDCNFQNGNYYLYFPCVHGQWGTGVAVSNKPEGPFKDAVGKPIMSKSIDPFCFIDDDGVAYLYQGGLKEGNWVARLNPDMLSLAEEPRPVDNGSAMNWEGPYVHKRNGIYYLSGSAGDKAGHYSMGDNPYGPFEYKGLLAPAPSQCQDHHAIVQFQGTWYYFYQVGDYTDSNGIPGSEFRRNICIDYLHYNPDGTIQPIVYTTHGVSSPGCLPG